eukprot:5671543-Alexandrium_andersonii.AAC.1
MGKFVSKVVPEDSIGCQEIASVLCDHFLPIPETGTESPCRPSGTAFLSKPGLLSNGWFSMAGCVLISDQNSAKASVLPPSICLVKMS